jgi:hypothetical protein
MDHGGVVAADALPHGAERKGKRLNIITDTIIHLGE